MFNIGKVNLTVTLTDETADDRFSRVNNLLGINGFGLYGWSMDGTTRKQENPLCTHRGLFITYFIFNFVAKRQTKQRTMSRRTFGVSLYARPQKVKKDGTAPVEVGITLNGEKASFQLEEFYKPEEFSRLRDSNRTNEVKQLCGKVTATLAGIRERHPEADAKTLKRYYLEGDPLESRIGRITVRKLLQIYLEEVVKGLPSFDKYRVTYDRFLKRFAYKSADDVSGGDIKGFLLDLKNDEGFAQGTLRNYYKRLSSAWSYGQRIGIVRCSPFSTLRMTFVDPEPVFLSFAEYERFKALEPDKEYLSRTQQAWLFMAGTGLEWADLNALEFPDVVMESGMLYIRKRRVKTGVEYFTVLVDEAPRIWERWVDEGRIYCPPNQDFNRWLKELARMAGITKNLVTLMARHQFASMLLGGYWGDRVSPSVIMKALGHSTLRQTLTYARLTEESQLRAFESIKK